MMVRLSSTLAAGLLGLVLLMGGCGDGSGLDVAEGRYRLRVEGHLVDTLTGPARVQPRRTGAVGLELGPREGSGLSIEIKPGTRSAQGPNAVRAASRLRPGRYDVVAASLLEGPVPADTLRGLIAFLSVTDGTFVATQGHVSVTQAGAGTIGGTFDLEMQERASPSPGERTVRVTGVFRATAP